jgi:rubredoxin
MCPRPNYLGVTVLLITPLGKSSPFLGEAASVRLRHLLFLVKGGARFATHLPSGWRCPVRRLASNSDLAKKIIHNMCPRPNYLRVTVLLVTALGESSPFLGADGRVRLRHLLFLVKAGARLAKHLPSGWRCPVRRLASDSGLAKKIIHNM